MLTRLFDDDDDDDDDVVRFNPTWAGEKFRTFANKKYEWNFHECSVGYRLL